MLVSQNQEERSRLRGLWGILAEVGLWFRHSEWFPSKLIELLHIRFVPYAHGTLRTFYWESTIHMTRGGVQKNTYKGPGSFRSRASRTAP